MAVRQPYSLQFTAELPSVNAPYLSVKPAHDIIAVQGGTPNPPNFTYKGLKLPATKIYFAGEMVKRGEAGFLLLVGGREKLIDAMKSYATDAVGVPKNKIMTWPKSDYTFEDAYSIERVADNLGAKRVAAVANQETVDTLRRDMKRMMPDKEVVVYSLDSNVPAKKKIMRYGFEKGKIIAHTIGSLGWQTPEDYVSRIKRSPLIKFTNIMRKLYDL